MMRPARLLPLALALVAGCQSLEQPEPDQGTPGSPVLASGQMAAQIDGSAWNTTNIVVAQSATFLKLTATMDAGLATSRTVVLQLTKTGAGSQVLGSTGPNGYAQIAIGTNDSALWSTITGGAQTGEVIITTFGTSRVVGTFSFTAKAASTALTPQNRVVTGGSFDVTF